jgi:hypothetical protein
MTENHYNPPNSKLLDSTLGKRRFIHSLFAALSGFITILVLLISASVVQTGYFASFGYGRALAVCTFFSLVAAASVLPFRTLAWYWAAIIGVFVSFVTAFAVIKTFF